jgi:hypothetical protein
MPRFLLIFSSVFVLQTAFSQVAPRAWQDHLSINSSNSVTKLGSRIYASNFLGVVYFDEQELSPQRLTKINGLSDVRVRLLRANPYNNKLLVIYENSNIDVIDINGNILNYPDIRLKTISGKKVINEVTFYGHLAYLACGFGIVVFDTERLEVKDTYIIGANASYLDVNQVALNDSMIFAATAKGMYRVNYKTRSPNNYRNWSADTLAMPAGPHNAVLNVAGTIICTYSAFRKSGVQGQDTFYVYKEHGSWIKYPPMASSGHTILKLGPVLDTLFAGLNINGMFVFSIRTGNLVNYSGSFNGETDYGTARDCYFSKDFSQNLSYWIADVRFGLYQTYAYHPYMPQNRITLNGMNRNLIARVDVHDGDVAVAPSYVDETGTGNYMREGVNVYRNKEWTYVPVISPDGQHALDITSVLLDRKDKKRLWATSWDDGVYEFENNKLVAVYNQTSAGVPERSDVHETRSAGLVQDKEGNVWFANSEQPQFLGVIKRNKQFQPFSFDAGRFVRKVFIDQNNTIWILHQREGGITVFKHSNFAGSSYKVLTNEAGKGGLQSNAVYAIAEDKDGKIWVGTSKGISVFYNPSAVFNNSGFDSQPIKILQGGNVELLLGEQTVTSIIVDGANNKWIGTNAGGLYCLSPDGTRQIYHFTTDNSPLYSNNIIDLNYDEVTGDVYIGSENGLQSFRSTVIEGAEDYSTIHAYPNPVKPEYKGTVLVRGLIDNSVVKVTDSAGNLMWETKSAGGQIEWPVTDLTGARVSTGVYLVYASTTDGSVRVVTKVLVVN